MNSLPAEASQHVNIEQLRHSLKVKWSVYYQQNRCWLVKLRIWGTDQGQRRPASSFILATLSTLEPELTEILPFMIALNNDPDRIVSALGLNFDPDEELKLMADHQLQLMPNEKLQPMTVAFNDHFNESTAATVAQVEAKGNDLLTQKQLDDEDAAGQAKSIETSNHLEEALSSTGKPNYAGLMLSILAVISSLAFVFGGFTG